MFNLKPKPMKEELELLYARLNKLELGMLELQVKVDNQFVMIKQQAAITGSTLDILKREIAR